MGRVRHYLVGLTALLALFIFSDLKAQISALNSIGGFESDMPSYWKMGKQTGATLSWATDQSRSMGRSLKIVKTATTSDSVYWMSENMADVWSPRIYKQVDIFLGAYVRTENVNTNPSGDDSKWWISYTFYDSAGVKIGEVKLPIDQTKASTGGWVADTNNVGQTILPKDAWTLIIKFVAGKNATGTVWADDFMLVGRNGGWAGQDWNTSVGVPTGWNYWLPPIGGNDGNLTAGYENTRLTTEAAHTGKYSLKFDIPKGTRDGWVGTKRFPLDPGIKAGDVLRLSVWVKASRLLPDSAAKNPNSWAVGFTPLVHTGWKNNDSPYDEKGPDMQFAFPTSKADTAFDWTQYFADFTVPTPDAGKPDYKALSVRLHIYGRFQGVVYFDDLNVQKALPTGVKKTSEVVSKFTLEQNYPNPFNPTTTIRYSIPEHAFVTLRIYDMLGREVKTLINAEQSKGVYNVIWNGENNYGSKVSSGTYIYRIEAGSYNQIKKMILLK